MSRRISRAARRYLITGQAEPQAYLFGHSGGRWASETLPDSADRRVYHFRNETDRAVFMERRPAVRPIGKRSPWARTFRARMFPDCRAAIISRSDVWFFTRSRGE